MHTPHTFEAIAPGRAELLGNHTDYNEGFVLSVAVDYTTTIRGHARSDNILRVHSLNLNQTHESDLSHIQPSENKKWVNYILGVLDEIHKRGIPLSGAELEIESNLPMGAGLSSSAALEIATALAARHWLNFTFPDIELAKIAQAAEHAYAGVRCGLLDQISSLMSRQQAVTFIDCRTYEVRHIPLPPTITLFIIHSGVKHALVSGEYNERRESCEAAATSLGVGALRDATTQMLEDHKATLPERIYRRAHHVIHENQRVLDAVRSLEAGELDAFGQLMYESHESSRTLFENSCVELDALVEMARKAPGCLGSRLSGGGFGGATISLVKNSEADAFETFMADAYSNYSGKDHPLILRTGARCGASSRTLP